jgi:predicted porin
MFIGGEDFQAGTGGIDGDGENLNINLVTDSGDAAKITYFTPRVGGFQLGASFTPDTGDAENDSDDDGDIEEHWELGANFTTSAGGADVTLTAVASIGDAEVGDDDLEDYGIGGGVEFGGLGIGAGYAFKQDLNEGEAFTIGAKYGFGPANVSAGYSYDDPDGGEKSGVLAFSGDYGLFPGVTLKGDLSFNDDDQGAGGDSTTAGVVTVQLDY